MSMMWKGEVGRKEKEPLQDYYKEPRREVVT